jgi:hypothetical protein
MLKARIGDLLVRDKHADQTDKHDQWQRTNNLYEDDLLPATKALDDAYTWIQKQLHQSPAHDASMSELRIPPRTAN